MNLVKPLLALLLTCAAIGVSLAQDARPATTVPLSLSPSLPASVSASQMAAAVNLVRTLNLQQYVQAMIENLAPPGIKRDITQRIVMQRIDMQAFEAFGARIYAETFSEEELRQLTVFFQSELGRKLQSKQAALQRNVAEAMASSPELMANFFVSGCAAGVVANAAEQARQFQSNLGQPPPTLDQVLQNIGPMVAKAEISCTCMYGKARATAQSKDPSKMFQEPGVKQAVDEAIRSGACPRPF